MKFRVTGGPDGDRGISSGSHRYEPGDVIELTQAKAQWLVDKGLLEPASGARSASKPTADTAETEVSNYENTVEDEQPEPWSFDQDSGDDL
jgi:hypothetical protein